VGKRSGKAGVVRGHKAGDKIENSIDYSELLEFEAE
jgi:hypothetical protein